MARKRETEHEERHSRANERRGRHEGAPPPRPAPWSHAQIDERHKPPPHVEIPRFGRHWRDAPGRWMIPQITFRVGRGGGAVQARESGRVGRVGRNDDVEAGAAHGAALGGAGGGGVGEGER